MIYLETAVLAATPEMVTMDQRQRRFEPEVLAVPVGSTVVFPNSDPVFHNVFSFSRAKQFDLGNYPRGRTRAVTFDKPGVVLVHCHLHPYMSGAILVTPSDWRVKPGPNGSYLLRDVPPGRYVLVAWHKAAGSFRRTVEVKDDGAVTLDFDIPLRELAAKR